jgi:hypothetical protein
MNELALVLAEPPGDEDGLRAIGTAIQVLGRFTFSHGEERSPEVNEYVWFGAREGEEISVLDDFALETRYMAIRTMGLDDARITRDLVASRLNVLSTATLLAEARGTNPLALVRLVIGSDEVGPDVADLVAVKLEDAAASVRSHAVIAAAMSRSSLLTGALERARARATDDRERRMLDAAIASCSDRSRC